MSTGIIRKVDIETKFIELCGDEGWECKKVVCKGERGWPDRAVLIPATMERPAVVVFVELKRVGGRPRPNQVNILLQLQAKGFIAFWSSNAASAIHHIKHQLTNFGTIKPR